MKANVNWKNMFILILVIDVFIFLTLWLCGCQSSKTDLRNGTYEQWTFLMDKQVGHVKASVDESGISTVEISNYDLNTLEGLVAFIAATAKAAVLP